MSEKRLITRHVQKHDVEANWLKATNFTPLVAEIIIYDIDAQHPHPRFKIGDGVTNVNLLPFAGVDEVSALLQAGKGDKAVQQVLDAASWAPDADQEEITQSSAEQSDGNLIVGALGQFSFMEGGKSQAKGKRAHAEGTSTVAVGNYSHSEGNKTGALGTNSHAEGLKSVAQGSVSHAEGSDTKSFGEASHTEGANTVTQGYASHAEGDGAQAIGNSSHAEGYESIAHGVAAHTEGRSNEAYGDFSHAEGMYSHANGEASHAGGRGAYTNAHGAFAHGDEVIATADFQTVFGRFNETDDEAAFIVGNGESDEARNNAFVIKQDGKVVVNGSALNIEGDKAAGSIKQTTDYASGTFGVENIPESVKDNALIQKDPATGEVLIGALGDFSSAFGGTSQASGKRAHAEGTTVVAAGKYSHAEGNGTVTLGNNTHAEGFKTIAEGPHSHAEGFRAHAVGEGSHAEGYNTKAEATNAHAEGSSTQALGTSSHSEGYEAIAQGIAAHAEGRSSVAQGNFSHAEGMYSHADGEASHAGGRGSYAYEPGSFAHGDEVVANVEFQTVFGRFNELDDEAAFIIGNGEDKENRSNLFTIKQDGRIYVNGEELSAGNIFFAEYGVTTRDEITAAYQAGKACMCKYEGYVYNLCAITEPYIFFSLLDCRLDVDLNGPTAKLVYVGFDDAWFTLQTNFVLPRHLKALNIRGRAQEKSVAQVTDYASWAPDDSQVELIADADVQKNENDEVLSGAFGAFSSAFGGTSQATAKRAHAEGTTTVAAGKYSHTEGNGTYTKGNSAHAEGILTAAIGDNAHSEGDHTRANGNSSHAEGGSTIADGTHSHAEGASTQAKGEQAHAEGAHTIAEGSNSHAEGESTHALGVNSHAEGQFTHAEGVNSHAEGSQTLASGYASHAGGEGSIAAHADSFVHGSGLVSGRDQQAVFGVFNEIDENAVFAVGIGYSDDDRRTGFQVNMDGQVFVNGNELVNNNNIENGANTGAISQKHNAESWTPDADQAEVIQSAANKTGNDIAVGAFGQYSFMEGGKSQAKGKRAHAEGTSTVAVGDYSHAEGNKTGSLGPNSHAEGLKSVAQGGASHAEGGNTKAIGEASHTEGVDTIARSYASHAEGAITETKKDYSHAEGYTSIADGIASHAEGYGTLTGNDAAHAEGLGTRAIGAYAHAEGAHTEATGDNSHAEGVATKATAYAAHAGGDSTEANHSGSFAHGAVLKTGRDQQAVFGKFNEVDADALFVVGNGESADAPRNAFKVTSDGKAIAGGKQLATLDDISGDCDVFVATYGTTTLSEIAEACRANKSIFLKIDSYWDPNTSATYANVVLPISSMHPAKSNLDPVSFSGLATQAIGRDMTTPYMMVAVVDTQNQWSIPTITSTSSGGEVDSNVFVATYNVTTYSEIDAAIKAGKAILVKGVNCATGDKMFYGLTLTLSHDHPADSSFPYYSFAGLGTPTTPELYAQSTYMISTMVDASGWKTPTALNLSDIVESENNVFIAEYGTTTEAEIDAALNAGKACFCHIPSYSYDDDESLISLINAYVPVVYGPPFAPFITFGAVVPAITAVGGTVVDNRILNVAVNCYGSSWTIEIQEVSGSADASGKMDKFGEVVTEDGSTTIALNGETMFYNTGAGVTFGTLNEDGHELGCVYVDDYGTTTVAGTALYITNYDTEDTITMYGDGISVYGHDTIKVTSGTGISLEQDDGNSWSVNSEGIVLNGNVYTEKDTACIDLSASSIVNIKSDGGSVDIGTANGATTIYGGSADAHTAEIHVYDDGIADVYANCSFEVYAGTEEDGMSTIAANTSAVYIDSAQVNIASKEGVNLYGDGDDGSMIEMSPGKVYIAGGDYVRISGYEGQNGISMADDGLFVDSTTTVSLSAGSSASIYLDSSSGEVIINGLSVQIAGLEDPSSPSDAVNKSYVDTKIGDIESVLDSIIAIQNSLLGGNA